MARERVAAWVGVAALYLVIAFWMTRPLAGHAFASIAGPHGDNLYFTWLVQWYRDSLAHGRLPVHVPTLNAPEGWSLAYNEMSPVMALLGVPGTAISAAFAYNLTFWLSFVLSGLFTCIWVHRLTGRLSAGVVAGLIFAFAPYRLSHAMGHLNLLGTQWLPLYFLCVTELLRGGRIPWAVGTGLSLVALAGTSQYYLYMAAVITVPFGAVLVGTRAGAWRDLRLRKNVAIAAAVAAPTIMLLSWPYVALARQGLLAPHALEDVQIWNASPTDFIMPAPVNWIVGDWVLDRFKADQWLEKTSTLGFVTMALALIGWTARRRDAASAPIVRALSICAAVAFVLALGTSLRWFQRDVFVPVPKIYAWLFQIDSFGVWLPGYVLFRWLPFYSSMRVWMRWGVFVGLFVSVLAGFGVERLARGRSGRVVVLLATTIGALVLIEFGQKPYPLTDVRPRAVDEWLAGRPERGLLVELPPDEMAKPEQTFYTSYHRQPFAGAFFSAFPSPQFRRIEPRLQAFPREDGIAVLRELGARWVIVDAARYADPARVRLEAARAGLEPMADLDGLLVFRMR